MLSAQVKTEPVLDLNLSALSDERPQLKLEDTELHQLTNIVFSFDSDMSAQGNSSTDPQRGRSTGSGSQRRSSTSVSPGTSSREPVRSPDETRSPQMNTAAYQAFQSLIASGPVPALSTLR